MSDSPRPVRKHLHADALIDTLRRRFATLPDARVQPTCLLADALMSGFAMFALKDPSLLAFEAPSQERCTKRCTALDSWGGALRRRNRCILMNLRQRRKFGADAPKVSTSRPPE